MTLTGAADVVEGGKASYTLTISDAPKCDLTRQSGCGVSYHLPTTATWWVAETRDVTILAGKTLSDLRCRDQRRRVCRTGGGSSR
ncbi:hypothetical protein Q9L41_13480 [Vibrio cholerae]|uniref:hypothetical protein n=1 Tax=Vibrio cholerae TaxID=666 RepID=UPI0027390958|nr:hypothetical protein [Vibrio cholerae]MDP4496826.1 hypothetical protein [Vibrio cholerae]